MRLPLAALSAVALAAALPSGAKADAMAYAATTFNDFGLLDLDTGHFSRLGNTGVALAGLGGGGSGPLYAVGNGTGTLYQVNTANGALTAVGNSGLSYVAFGSTANGNLYALTQLPGDRTNNNLYRINASNGSAALIGELLLNDGSHPPGTPAAVGAGTPGAFLSTGSSSLLVTDQFGIYVTNPATASVSGAVFYAANAAVVEGQNAYYSLNEGFFIQETTNAGCAPPLFGAVPQCAVSNLAVTGLMPGEALGPSELAPTTASPPTDVPEPASLALFGAGLAFLGLTRRSRKRDRA